MYEDGDYTLLCWRRHANRPVLPVVQVLLANDALLKKS